VFHQQLTVLLHCPASVARAAPKKLEADQQFLERGSPRLGCRYAESVDSLMRLREPAAWVALGVLVLNLLLTIITMITFDGSVASVAWVLSARVANPVPLIVLAVLVSFCVLRERTPHARELTVISLVVGVIAVLFGLVLTFLGLGAPAPALAVFAMIVPQAISVLAVGLLIKLLQLQAVPRRLPPGIGLIPHEPESLPAPSVPDQRLQPTWHPDTAAGAAWSRAGDAAAGAPASGWGADASSAAWQPIPTQPNGPGPTDRPQDPRADQGQRNSQPPTLDWWGRPQS
jgi:hypothetical protein